MQTADIQEQNVVNEDPHIIVAVELVGHRGSVQSAVLRLSKFGFQLHAEVIIGIRR